MDHWTRDHEILVALPVWTRIPRDHAEPVFIHSSSSVGMATAGVGLSDSLDMSLREDISAWSSVIELLRFLIVSSAASLSVLSFFIHFTSWVGMVTAVGVVLSDWMVVLRRVILWYLASCDPWALPGFENLCGFPGVTIRSSSWFHQVFQLGKQNVRETRCYIYSNIYIIL